MWTPFFLLLLAPGLRGARIIMTSPQIISHVLEQVALGEELVKKGHEVYVALESNFPQSQIDGILKKGIKVLKFHLPAELQRFAGVEFEKELGKEIFENKGDMMSTIGLLNDRIPRDCQYMMDDAKFLDQLKQLKFSLGIVEPFFFGYCNLILPKFLGIPFVSLTNMYDTFAIRAPALPSIYPRFFLSIDNTQQISFKTRFVQFIYQFCLAINFPIQLNSNTSLLEKYAPEHQSWKDLLRQSSIFFYEVDHHLAAPLPSLPNHISLAGLTCKPSKPLLKDLESLMTSNKDGVILMTFGSLGNLFPEEILAKFLKAFGQLKQTVIAKFKVEPDRKLPANVKVMTWLPQNDILGHSNLKLFITHCGNNGQHEAMYHGVPMLGFPLYAEQKENCHRGFMKGFGECLNINDFTVEELVEKINLVINDKSYKEKIGRASEVFQNQPMSPQERATFWIEHILKFGDSHLRSPAMDLPLYQFLLLDVMAVFLALTAAILLLLVCVVKCMCKCMCGKKASKLKVN